MTITKIINDGQLIINIEGILNSSNAQEASAKVDSEPSVGVNSILIDIKKLDYISSAGLRIILSLKKRAKAMPFKIINANNDVMKVFDDTGFSSIMDIEQGLREVSIDGCKMIGHGACGEVYRLDDEQIIKLYYPFISDETIELEKVLSKKAFTLDIPTAISFDIVSCNGRKGVVYELINSKTVTELIREDYENVNKYVSLYASTCKKIHSIDGKDSSLPSFKDLNRDDVKYITDITEDERKLLYHFIDLVPDGTTCIHGDLNPNNIMFSNGECCLIDMGEFSTGIKEWDISRILFSLKYGNMFHDFNDFYKLTAEQVNTILNLFLDDYYGTHEIDEIISKDDDSRFLMPLAWFRCICSMLKGDRWTKEFKDMASDLLHNHLIPFIKEEDK